MADDGPAEVSIDGVAQGALAGGSALTLENIPVGAHTLRVSRPGAEPCIEEVAVRPAKVEVATCRFARPSTSGFVVLESLTAKHRVFLNRQEISRQSARRPIRLEAGRSYELEILEGGQRIDVQTIRVRARAATPPSGAYGGPFAGRRLSCLSLARAAAGASGAASAHQPKADAPVLPRFISFVIVVAGLV